MFKKFIKDTVDAAKRYAPAALTPEKRFAKALINVSSLMTMADGKAEDSEIEAASEVIFNHTSIKQFLTPQEAHEMYSLGIGKLQTSAGKSSTAMKLEVNAIIAEIADSVKEGHRRREVVETAKMIGESNGNGRMGDDEKAMLAKIESALA